MKMLNNEKVQKFLDDLRDFDNEKYQIVQQCRKIVLALNPDICERIIYGGIMFSLNGEDFGGIFAGKNHVSFEFGKGYKLNDPNKLLEGKGKYRRHLKLKSIADIKDKQVESYIRQLI